MSNEMLRGVKMNKVVIVYVKKYWFLILWILFNFYLFWKTYRYYKTQPQFYYLRTMLGYWLCISRGSAEVITMCSFVILLPVCRSLQTLFHPLLAKISSTALAFWLSKIKTMHTVCACTLIVAGVLHSVAHGVNAVNFSRHFNRIYPEINWAEYKNEDPIHLLVFTVAGCTGIGMLLLLFLMALSSMQWFRTSYYNIFYTTHHLFILYLLLQILHPIRGVLKQQTNTHDHIPGCIVKGNHTDEMGFPEPTYGRPGYCSKYPFFSEIPKMSWIWSMLALVLYALELIHRRFCRHKCEAIQASQVPENCVYLKIKTPKKFKASPGEYILLQCSDISNIEWHPFTVTSYPTKTQQNLTVLISVRGDWTRSLYKLVNTPFGFNECTSHISRLCHKRLLFSIDGPFASPMQAIKTSKIAYCVAAGIGITPYLSILQYLLYYLLMKYTHTVFNSYFFRENSTTVPKRLHLIWIVRNPNQICIFKDLFCNLHKKFWEENYVDRLQMKFFITGDSQQNEIEAVFTDCDILKCRMHKGRPDWNGEFRILHFMYPRKLVTVYSCGPKKLTRQLRKKCHTASKCGYKFSFIHEGFS